MRLIVTSLAALGALAGTASAETFAATEVHIEHTAAVLEVIPEDRANVDVQVAAGESLAAPSARLANGRVTIDGGLRYRLRGCVTNGVRITGAGNIARSDLPRITIRTPRTLDLHIGGAVFTRIGASQGGEVVLVGCGDTDVAAVNGALEITLTGSGGADVTSVAGPLEAALTGSGSLSVMRADAGATLRATGSGGLTIGDVAGLVDARLTGSGSLNVGAIGEGARLSLTGSGGVEAGAVRGALNAQLTGSGSVEIASVSGPNVDLRVNSSGDIIVRGGQTERLNAQSNGSGNVRFGGRAEVTSVELHGSGDIAVADGGRFERVVDNGSGNLRIGN